MTYLKYYIFKKDGREHLDCVLCHENQEPVPFLRSEEFIEWLDRDKWEYVPPNGPIPKGPEGFIQYIWSGGLRRRI